MEEAYLILDLWPWCRVHRDLISVTGIYRELIPTAGEYKVDICR